MDANKGGYKNIKKQPKTATKLEMGIFDVLGKLYGKLKPVLAPFEWVGKKVAWVINSTLLTIVYFTVFSATAIIAKILRKKFLQLSPDKTAKSYWMERKKEDYSRKETYRGF